MYCTVSMFVVMFVCYEAYWQFKWPLGFSVINKDLISR